MKTIKEAYEELNGDLNNCLNSKGDEFLFINAHSGVYLTLSGSQHESLFELICTVEEFNNYKPEKTVLDAVIEYEGEWPSTDFASAYYINRAEGYWYCGESTPYNDQHVCNIEQFNTEVDSLSRHAGTELYKIYVKAIKTPLKRENKVDYTSEEFWKDAPKGATHVMIWEFGNNFWYDASVSGYANFFEHGKWKESGWKVEDVLSLKKARGSIIIPRPIQSPVYTQEMVDAGLFPSVGMEVEMVTLENFTSFGHIEFKNEIGFLFRHKEDALCDFMEFSGHVKFKPLKSAKQKAIDELIKEYHEEFPFDNDSMMLSLAYDKWVV